MRASVLWRCVHSLLRPLNVPTHTFHPMYVTTQVHFVHYIIVTNPHIVPEYPFFWRSETDLDQKSLESRDCLGRCGLAKMDQKIWGQNATHWMWCMFLAGFNRLDMSSQKKWMKNMLGTICHKWRVDGQFVHFFCGRYERFGVDEQSVHFHVRLGCSVTVEVMYMGRKIQWTIHVGRNVTRTRRTGIIHHSTRASCYSGLVVLIVDSQKRKSRVCSNVQ